MEQFRNQVEEAAKYIQRHLRIQPRVGIVLGTGLGSTAEAVRDPDIIRYADIPHFPVSTVPSHMGRIVCGLWADQPVAILQGRMHLYEGYTPKQVSFPIRVMAALGIRTLMLSNAAGGLNPHFRSGDLMLITDHINLTGQNPLVGPNVDAWGPRFPDMTEPYSKRLQQIACKASLKNAFHLHRGVFAGVLGPSLETAAETRFLRTIGADAVGMSIIMEVITAIHANLECLGISVITNINLPDNYLPAPLEEIIATAEQAGPRLMRLFEEVLQNLPPVNEGPTQER